MSIALYIRRVLIMVLGAMPITVLVLSALELSRGIDRGVFDTAGGAAGLVYVWGVVTGGALSLVHTALMQSGGFYLTRSMLLGALLGVGFGAITPTLFTGLLEPAAMALGALTGASYGFLVTRLSGKPTTISR